MEKITINGKEFELRKIDFNAVCELEDLGMSIIDIKDKTFKSIRALVAFVEKQGGVTPQFGVCLPIVSIVLYWLAYKGIKHDDDLVRSADRLR